MNKKQAAKSLSLFRGDHKNSVAVPSPLSSRGIVSHVLYLDGIGRDTPFTSTTEDFPSAQIFAGKDGRVWVSTPATAASAGAGHVSKKELLHLLKGYGKGKAKWNNPLQVAQARAYVERWSEHLINWQGFSGDLELALKKVFK